MKTELQRLLCEEALTLNTELDIMRAAELTTRDQAKKIDGEVQTSVIECCETKSKKPHLIRSGI